MLLDFGEVLGKPQELLGVLFSKQVYNKVVGKKLGK